MQRFTELKVWQRSHALVLDLYRATATFPDDERFGIISQLRRAAASVPTNIAEGSRRVGSKDYARFLNLAEGSAAEVEYLTILSHDLGYLSDEQTRSIISELDEISRMLNALRRKVQASPSSRL